MDSPIVAAVVAASPSTSSLPLSYTDSLLKLKADVDDVLAPLKALNDEQQQHQPNKQHQQKHHQKSMEIEQQIFYMKRLESFNKFRGNWLNLPPRISPISLASHGWNAYKEDTVKCEQCNAFLNVKVSSSNNSSSSANGGDLNEQKFAIKYISNQIRSKHDSSCIWYSKVITQLPDEDFNLREAFIAVKLLLRKHKNQPFDYYKTINREPILDEKMTEYLQTLLKENEKACLISFHAWLPDDDTNYSMIDGLKCRLCAARIGIDPYIMKMPFNPIKFHERYCPVRVNTKAFQENILLRNMDDLKGPNNIAENLRGIHDYIDYFNTSTENNEVVVGESTQTSFVNSKNLSS